jgi:hypothetical protein
VAGLSAGAAKGLAGELLARPEAAETTKRFLVSRLPEGHFLHQAPAEEAVAWVNELLLSMAFEDAATNPPAFLERLASGEISEEEAIEALVAELADDREFMDELAVFEPAAGAEANPFEVQLVDVLRGDKAAHDRVVRAHGAALLSSVRRREELNLTVDTNYRDHWLSESSPDAAKASARFEAFLRTPEGREGLRKAAEVVLRLGIDADGDTGQLVERITRVLLANRHAECYRFRRALFRFHYTPPRDQAPAFRAG